MTEDISTKDLVMELMRRKGVDMVVQITNPPGYRNQKLYTVVYIPGDITGILNGDN